MSIRDTFALMAHELGHNLGLGHAPCGNPEMASTRGFRILAANTGAWGYDFTEKALVAPRTPDLMSYCTRGGYWISDFFFNKALRHRLADVGAAAAAMTSASRSPCAPCWCGADATRTVSRTSIPLSSLRPRPLFPPQAGITPSTEGLLTGTSIFSFTFDMPVTADAEGDATSFVFALPVQAGWDDALASITVSGPGGSATLDENTDRPMAILRDPQSGRVRGFLRDLPTSGPDQSDRDRRPSLSRAGPGGDPQPRVAGCGSLAAVTLSLPPQP